MHYDPLAKKIGEKFLKCKRHHKKFLFNYCVIFLCFIQGFTRIVDGVKDLSLHCPNTIPSETPLSSHITSMAHSNLVK